MFVDDVGGCYGGNDNVCFFVVVGFVDVCVCCCLCVLSMLFVVVVLVLLRVCITFG